MRKILIVGAGQAGLQLGLGLLQHGYDVTIMSARTPEELRVGRVMSTQVIFGPGMAIERELRVNLWEEDAPKVVELEPTLAAPPGNVALQFAAPLDEHAQSVDQRVKMAGWLELFENRGGKVIYHSVMTSDLEGLVGLNDLTIIAAGKGELVELFDRDPARSPYDTAQRALAVIYLHGVTQPPGREETFIRINVAPEVGELFSIPAYTTSGPCHIQFLEGNLGGPFDCWQDRPDPKAHLDRTLALLREYFPWEYERTVDAQPTDARSCLTGSYPPVVRKPVGSLSPTAHVLGIADVVVANDPIAGQGSNNAVHAADVYLTSILERGDEPFDVEWMERTFEKYWEYAQFPTGLSNALLGPIPEHVQQVLGAATQLPRVAHRFANNYADPTDLTPVLGDPAATEAWLAEEAKAAEK
jgi:hypothetical protein